MDDALERQLAAPFLHPQGGVVQETLRILKRVF